MSKHSESKHSEPKHSESVYTDKYRFYDISGEGILNIRLSAIKSSIETDTPESLAEIIHGDRDAHIYALIKCFTFIPATKCITYLISTGITLDDTFDSTPYNMTPRQYLEKYFDTTSKTYARAKEKIFVAIEEGIRDVNKMETNHIEIPIPPPVEKKMKRRGKIMTAFSLLKRMNTS